MTSSFTPFKKGLSAIRQRNLPRMATMLGLLTVFAGVSNAQCPTPVLSACPNGTVTAFIGPNSCAAGLNYTVAATQASNAVLTYALIGATNGTGTGIGSAFFNRGLTDILVTATNSCGSTTCAFSLNVLDSIRPNISDRPNVTVNADANGCGAKAGYVAPTMTDNCPLCSTPNLTALGFGFLGTFGGHDYYRSPILSNWNRIDSIAQSIGGYLVAINTAAEDSFIAAVVPDSQLAWIGFTDVATEGTWEWSNGDPVTYTNWCDNQPDDWLTNQDYAAINSQGLFGPTGCWDDIHSPGNPVTGILTNAYGIIETIGCGSLVRTAGLDSGSTFPIGTTIITYLATDPSGNTSTKSFNVTVVDNQLPVITCPKDTVLPANSTNTSTSATGVATATDNCGIPVVTSLDSVILNVIYRNWTATDASGNTAKCTQKITTGSCPSCNIAVTASNSTFTGGNPRNIYIGYGPQSANLSVTPTAPGTTFAWSGNGAAYLSNTAIGNPTFTPTAAGNYTLTVTKTGGGCTTTCTVNFCVKDVRVPNNVNCGGGNGAKVYVCHVPPGNPGNAHTICVGISAVPAHIGNHDGDGLGDCSGLCSPNTARMTAPVGELIMDEDLEMIVYPNPFNSNFHIKIESNAFDVADIFVYDLTGRIVERHPAREVGADVVLGENLRPGVYVVEVRHGELSKRLKITKM